MKIRNLENMVHSLVVHLTYIVHRVHRLYLDYTSTIIMKPWQFMWMWFNNKLLASFSKFFTTTTITITIPYKAVLQKQFVLQNHMHLCTYVIITKTYMASLLMKYHHVTVLIMSS